MGFLSDPLSKGSEIYCNTCPGRLRRLLNDMTELAAAHPFTVVAGKEVCSFSDGVATPSFLVLSRPFSCVRVCVVAVVGFPKKVR